MHPENVLFFHFPFSNIDKILSLASICQFWIEGFRGEKDRVPFFLIRMELLVVFKWN